MSTKPNVIALYKLEAHQHPQAQACARCEVRRSALFGALDFDRLDLIHETIDAYDVAPDAPVLRAGDEDAYLYTIRAGIVRFERVTAAGERRITRLAGRGDLLGQEALIGQRHLDDAIACTPVSLCRIPRQLISEVGTHENDVVVELMRRWQLALDDAHGWVTDLSTGPALRRMLHLLARLDDFTDERGLIWLPRREDMGAMLDLTIETASRLVSGLKRDGVITLHPPKHAKLDRAKLRAALADAIVAA